MKLRERFIFVDFQTPQKTHYRPGLDRDLYCCVSSHTSEFLNVNG